MNCLRLGLLVMLLPCLGCLEIEIKQRDANLGMRRPAAAPSAPGGGLAPAAPISAEQVTAENARDMAQALWDEFDREEMENDRQLLETPQPKR
jgi:hypothetical protein